MYGIEKKTFCGDDVGSACCSRAAGGGGPFTYGKAVLSDSKLGTLTPWGEAGPTSRT